MNETDDYDQKYTKPELRREIKRELMDSDKGGRPGQWSARKSQMLVQEYERRGGDYRSDAKDEDAESLQRWTDQNWQTADGSAYADDGSRMKRYLPEDAWDLLSDEEKKRAQQAKAEGDRHGKQFVQNTAAAKAARAYVDHGDAADLSQDQLGRLTKRELEQIARKQDISGRSKMRKAELAEAIARQFRDAPENLSKSELYQEAQDRDIDHRSEMDKPELADAVRKARAD